MKVTIIGTGNSACAQATKLVERGHQVSMVKTSHSMHEDNYDAIVRQQGIYYTDHYKDDDTRHFASIRMITRDVEAGVQDAEVILVLTQSLQHETIARLLAPYLHDGQIVWLIPGNMGSVYFQQHVQADIRLLESESTPYDARISTPGTVDVLFKNVRNAVAFLHKTDEQLLPLIDSLFGEHKYLRSNIVESAMHNPNMVVHTVGTLMSASRIEQMNGEFWMYRESFSPSIWNLIHALDAEKNAVIQHYGGVPLAYAEACRWRNEEDLTTDPYAAFRNYAQSGGPKGPSSLHTRFIYEDVPMGLCLLESLAQKASIPTPIASSLISIANALLQTDFRAGGRTLNALNLQNYTVEQIKAYIS